MTISTSRLFYMVPESQSESELEQEENDSFCDDDDDDGDGDNAVDNDNEGNQQHQHCQPTLIDIDMHPYVSCLSSLHEHDCLVVVLGFLAFQDLNNFSLVSKQCYNARSHETLDQTREGSIYLGKGIQSIDELVQKIRQKGWDKHFEGNRTHLHLSGLNSLSSNIESIDGEFIENFPPLEHVKSLDCSTFHVHCRSYRNRIRGNNRNTNCQIKSGSDHESPSSEATDETLITHDDSNSRPFPPSPTSWLFPYRDYIDKGFAHGLVLSLLVPNLREIDMSNLPLTSIGVAWIAENNPKLEVLTWNGSLIWPINEDIMRACLNLKELYIDDARLLFDHNSRRQRSRRLLQIGDRNSNETDNHEIADENNNNSNNYDTEAILSSMAQNFQSLVRVSCRRIQWYNENSRFTNIRETKQGQASLMRFVRLAPNLKWFRSDLTIENIAILKEERPDVIFCC